MAVANPGQAPTGVQNSVSAIGNGTADNVYVDGGNFSSKVASLASGTVVILAVKLLALHQAS